VSQKKSWHRAVKYDHSNLLVSFDRGDYFVELWNSVRAKDVQRRTINCYPPVVGRAPRKIYLAVSCGGMSFFRHFVSPWLDYLIDIDSFEVMASNDHCRPALLAASTITAATSFGFDNIGTWPVGRVVVVA